MMISNRNSLDRRFFLRSLGATIALPALESMTPGMLNAAVRQRAGSGNAPAPRRMVCIGNSLGFYAPEFFPKTVGRQWEATRLLKPLEPHRADLTVFAGLDHDVKGGHFAVHSYLSGVRAVDAKSMPEGNISLDQRAAETVGGATRFNSLTIGSEDGIHGGCMMSWTRSGTRVPPIPTPRELFRKLFVADDEADREASRDRFRLRGSILDAVSGDAQSLQNRLTARDRDKLDEYFTSVRDVEKEIELRRQWADVPKPEAAMPEPPNRDFVSDLPVLYDLVVLALQTDSTRIATLEIAGGFRAAKFGLRKGYHSLSHHGKVRSNIDDLLVLEDHQVEQFARFLAKLRSIKEVDGSLLDNTMVLFGSGMGNANNHTNLNLPLVLAGGGFEHGEYREYPRSGLWKQPLCNLYLTLLQRFGVEVDRFGLSTGTLRGFA